MTGSLRGTPSTRRSCASRSSRGCSRCSGTGARAAGGGSESSYEIVDSNGVVVGSGAQVLGPIEVGKNAKIGSNAVVTKDVPENAVMIGIPARNVGTATEEFKPYAVTEESKESD